MNKNTVYIVIAVFGGLLLGWLIFGITSNDSFEKNSQHNHDGEGVSQMWTCSMHPQIMQPEPGDCPICGMELIPAEGSAGGLAVNEIKMTTNAMALANVSTTIIGGDSADTDRSLILSGRIKINEEANSVQASYFDGRLEQLNIDYEGQDVRKGALLATIYSPELVAAQQELITAVSLKESQPSLHKAVRNKLKLWKLSEQQIDAIETSGVILEHFPIYATVSGTVAEKMATEGDYVKKGQPLLKVSNLNSVWAEFDAYENQIAQFKTGQEIKIVSNAYPNDEFDAEVSFIAPVLNTQNRTVTVRATLNNRDGNLKPGMFVKGKVENGAIAATEKYMIPATAVMWTGERSVVYVKTSPNEPIFQMREITLGGRTGERYEVVSGLDAGDEIVTNGTFTVDAAAQLQGKKSMMNQGVVQPGPETKETVVNMEFPQSFQANFQVILGEYLKMKDAFVKSDSEDASKIARSAFELLETISEENLGEMEKNHFAEVAQRLEAIANTSSLEKQRVSFVGLNENIVSVVLNMDQLEGDIYVQKCPMANNNKGAFWLSSNRAIKNPYYGEQMLTCGSVIDSVMN